MKEVCREEDKEEEKQPRQFPRSTRPKRWSSLRGAILFSLLFTHTHAHTNPELASQYKTKIQHSQTTVSQSTPQERPRAQPLRAYRRHTHGLDVHCLCVYKPRDCRWARACVRVCVCVRRVIGKQGDNWRSQESPASHATTPQALATSFFDS